MSAGNRLIREWVSYPWRIDRASARLGQSTMIHSPSFPGAGRRWQLSLIARSEDGLPLDALPLFVTVIDPTSLVVTASVEANVLVGSGWTSVGVSDKRVMIDINESHMGTVLVDERFLTRGNVGNYVNDSYDTLTIRCRIHVFDDDQLDALSPQPNRVTPAVRAPPPPNGRKTRRDSTDRDSVPAKRRRIR